MARTSNAETHARAEAAAPEALRGAAFCVTNLSKLTGTSKSFGDFPSPPAGARTLCAFADAGDCHGICAFVQFAGDSQVIQFETAAMVAELAEETETAFGRATYLHVNVEQFNVTADRIFDLLK